MTAFRTRSLLLAAASAIVCVLIYRVGLGGEPGLGGDPQSPHPPPPPPVRVRSLPPTNIVMPSSRQRSPLGAIAPSVFLYVGAYFDVFPLHFLRCRERRVVFIDPLYGYRRFLTITNASGPALNAHFTSASTKAEDDWFEEVSDHPLRKTDIDAVAEQLVLELGATATCGDRPTPSALDGYVFHGRTIDYGDQRRRRPPRIKINFASRGLNRTLLFVVARTDEIDFSGDNDVLSSLRVSTLAYTGSSTNTLAPAVEKLLCPPGVELPGSGTLGPMCAPYARKEDTCELLLPQQLERHFSGDYRPKTTATGFRVLMDRDHHGWKLTDRAEDASIMHWFLGMCTPPPLDYRTTGTRIAAAIERHVVVHGDRPSVATVEALQRDAAAAESKSSITLANDQCSCKYCTDKGRVSCSGACYGPSQTSADPKQ